MADRKKLTNNEGIPVSDNQNSLTAGPRGPVLMQDAYLIEKMAHFVDRYGAKTEDPATQKV